jgi:hypothetical protein
MQNRWEDKKKVQFFDKTGATHLQESHWET